jgi:NAD(P)-dependent dehydrogenase (short-subunit alcohol dehydrogenase family)
VVRAWTGSSRPRLRPPEEVCKEEVGAPFPDVLRVDHRMGGQLASRLSHDARPCDSPLVSSSFEGKVALVTGGASGLGRATAGALAHAGARIVVADIDEAGGREVAAGLDADFVLCDVTSLDHNLAAVQTTLHLHGALDLVHLNAGIVSGCGIGEDFDPERYAHVVGVNLDGVVFGTHAALPALKQSGGGSIVATASLAGLTAVPADPFYAATKHAVVGLARSLGPALAPDGVRFNAVCPSFAETNIIAGVRAQLEAEGIPILAAETVAEAVLEVFGGEGTGECWFVQYGRAPEPFEFRGIPGARAAATGA